MEAMEKMAVDRRENDDDHQRMLRILDQHYQKSKNQSKKSILEYTSKRCSKVRLTLFTTLMLVVSSWSMMQCRDPEGVEEENVREKKWFPKASD